MRSSGRLSGGNDTEEGTGWAGGPQAGGRMTGCSRKLERETSDTSGEAGTHQVMQDVTGHTAEFDLDPKQGPGGVWTGERCERRLSGGRIPWLSGDQIRGERRGGRGAGPRGHSDDAGETVSCDADEEDRTEDDPRGRRGIWGTVTMGSRKVTPVL